MPVCSVTPITNDRGSRLGGIDGLDGAETLQRGDSVIREDMEIVIDDPADYSWMQGDQLGESAAGADVGFAKHGSADHL